MPHVSTNALAVGSREQKTRRSDKLFADVDAFVSDYIRNTNIAALEGFKEDFWGSLDP